MYVFWSGGSSARGVLTYSVVLCDCSFVFNGPGTTEIYTLSLHDALPICVALILAWLVAPGGRHECFWLVRSEEHTSELQSHSELVCRLLLEKKKGFTIQTQRLGIRQLCCVFHRSWWSCVTTPTSTLLGTS